MRHQAVPPGIVLDGSTHPRQLIMTLILSHPMWHVSNLPLTYVRAAVEMMFASSWVCDSVWTWMKPAAVQTSDIIQCRRRWLDQWQSGLCLRIYLSFSCFDGYSAHKSQPTRLMLHNDWPEANVYHSKFTRILNQFFCCFFCWTRECVKRKAPSTVKE